VNTAERVEVTGAEPAAAWRSEVRGIIQPMINSEDISARPALSDALSSHSVFGTPVRQIISLPAAAIAASQVRSEVRVRQVVRFLQGHPYFDIHELIDGVPYYQEARKRIEAEKKNAEDGRSQMEDLKQRILDDIKTINDLKLVRKKNEKKHFEGFFREMSPETGEWTGKLVSYSYMHENGKYYSSVYAVVVSEDGQRILLQQFNKPQEADFLEVSVTGHVEPNESPLISALREMEEELGIRMDNKALIAVSDPKTKQDFFVRKDRYAKNDSYPGTYDYQLLRLFCVRIPNDIFKSILKHKYSLEEGRKVRLISQPWGESAVRLKGQPEEAKKMYGTGIRLLGEPASGSVRAPLVGDQLMRQARQSPVAKVQLVRRSEVRADQPVPSIPGTVEAELVGLAHRLNSEDHNDWTLIRPINAIFRRDPLLFRKYVGAQTLQSFDLATQQLFIREISSQVAQRNSSKLTRMMKNAGIPGRERQRFLKLALSAKENDASCSSLIDILKSNQTLFEILVRMEDFDHMQLNVSGLFIRQVARHIMEIGRNRSETRADRSTAGGTSSSDLMKKLVGATIQGESSRATKTGLGRILTKGVTPVFPKPPKDLNTGNSLKKIPDTPIRRPISRSEARTQDNSRSYLGSRSGLQSEEVRSEVRGDQAGLPTDAVTVVRNGQGIRLNTIYGEEGTDYALGFLLTKKRDGYFLTMRTSFSPTGGRDNFSVERQLVNVTSEADALAIMTQIETEAAKHWVHGEEQQDGMFESFEDKLDAVLNHREPKRSNRGTQGSSVDPARKVVMSGLFVTGILHVYNHLAPSGARGDHTIRTLAELSKDHPQAWLDLQMYLGGRSQRDWGRHYTGIYISPRVSTKKLASALRDLNAWRAGTATVVSAPSPLNSRTVDLITRQEFQERISRSEARENQVVSSAIGVAQDAVQRAEVRALDASLIAGVLTLGWALAILAFGWIKFKKRGTNRFERISAGDEQLTDRQVQQLVASLSKVPSEIIFVTDANDELLPESAVFMPNLMAEFRVDPKLAMVHGMGKNHAWIRVSALKDALSSYPPETIHNYGSLFAVLDVLGYHIRRVKYVNFRSSLHSARSEVRMTEDEIERAIESAKEQVRYLDTQIERLSQLKQGIEVRYVPERKKRSSLSDWPDRFGEGEQWYFRVQPAPLFPGHVIGFHEGVSEELADAADIDKMIRTATDLPGFCVYYNAPGSGASLPKKKHFQFGRVVFPVENARVESHGMDGNVSVGIVENFPASGWVLRGSRRDRAALVRLTERYLAVLKQHAVVFNLLIRNIRQPGIDDVRIIIIPRKAETTPATLALMKNKPAAVEVGGIFITEDEEDFNRLSNNAAIRKIFQEISFTRAEVLNKFGAFPVYRSEIRLTPVESKGPSVAAYDNTVRHAANHVLAAYQNVQEGKPAYPGAARLQKILSLLSLAAIVMIFLPFFFDAFVEFIISTFSPMKRFLISMGLVGAAAAVVMTWNKLDFFNQNYKDNIWARAAHVVQEDLLSVLRESDLGREIILKTWVLPLFKQTGFYDPELLGDIHPESNGSWESNDAGVVSYETLEPSFSQAETKKFDRYVSEVSSLAKEMMALRISTGEILKAVEAANKKIARGNKAGTAKSYFTAYVYRSGAMDSLEPHPHPDSTPVGVYELHYEPALEHLKRELQKIRTRSEVRLTPVEGKATRSVSHAAKIAAASFVTLGVFAALDAFAQMGWGGSGSGFSGPSMSSFSMSPSSFSFSPFRSYMSFLEVIKLSAVMTGLVTAVSAVLWVIVAKGFKRPVQFLTFSLLLTVLLAVPFHPISAGITIAALVAGRFLSRVLSGSIFKGAYLYIRHPWPVTIAYTFLTILALSEFGYGYWITWPLLLSAWVNLNAGAGWWEQHRLNVAYKNHPEAKAEEARRLRRLFRDVDRLIDQGEDALMPAMMRFNREIDSPLLQLNSPHFDQQLHDEMIRVLSKMGHAVIKSSRSEVRQEKTSGGETTAEDKSADAILEVARSMGLMILIPKVAVAPDGTNTRDNTSTFYVAKPDARMTLGDAIAFDEKLAPLNIKVKFMHGLVTRPEDYPFEMAPFMTGKDSKLLEALARVRTFVTSDWTGIRTQLEQKWETVRLAHNQVKAGTAYVIPKSSKHLDFPGEILERRSFEGAGKHKERPDPSASLDPNPPADVSRPPFMVSDDSTQLITKFPINGNGWRLVVAGDGELRLGSLLVPDRDIPLTLADDSANFDLLTFHANTHLRGYVNSWGIGGLNRLHDHVFDRVPERFENLQVDWNPVSGSIKTGHFINYPVDSKVLASDDLKELAAAMTATAKDYMIKLRPFVVYLMPGRVVFIPMDRSAVRRWDIETNSLDNRWLSSLFLFGIAPFPEKALLELTPLAWTRLMSQIGVPLASGSRSEVRGKVSASYVVGRRSSTYDMQHTQDGIVRSETRETPAFFSDRDTEERKILEEKGQPVFDFLSAQEEYLAREDRWNRIELKSLDIPAGTKTLAMILGSWDQRTAHEAARVIKELQSRGIKVQVLTSGKYGNKPGIFFDEAGNKLPEAVGYRKILAEEGVSVDFIEPDSTNSGENIVFSKKRLDQDGVDSQVLLVMQNPLLQKRAGLAIVRQYFGIKDEAEAKTAFVKSGIRLISYAPYVPVLSDQSNQDVLRDLEYALTEIQSLQVYPKKGYSIAVEIPQEILDAADLLKGLVEKIRKRAALDSFKTNYQDPLLKIAEYPDETGVKKILRGMKLDKTGHFQGRVMEPGAFPMIHKIPANIEIIQEAKAEFRDFMDGLRKIFPGKGDKIQSWTPDDSAYHIALGIFQEHKQLMVPTLKEYLLGLLKYVTLFFSDVAGKGWTSALKTLSHNLKELFQPFPVLTLEEKAGIKALVSDRLRTEPGPVDMLRVGYGVTADGGFVMFLWDKSGRMQALKESILDRAKKLTNGKVGGRPKGGHVTIGRILNLPYSADPTILAGEQRKVFEYVEGKAKAYQAAWDKNLENPAVYPVSRVTILHENQWLTLRDAQTPPDITDIPLGLPKPFVKTFNSSEFGIGLEVAADAFQAPEGRFHASKVVFNRLENHANIMTQEAPGKEETAWKDDRKPAPGLRRSWSEKHPAEIAAFMPNGNLGMNDSFVGIVNGEVFYYRGDALLESRPYDMLIRMNNGETGVRSLRFSKKDNKVWDALDPDQKNIADDIAFGVFGQHIVQNGKFFIDGKKVDQEVVLQFDDLRHLFRFPMFVNDEGHQTHHGFSDGKGELYTDRLRQAVARVLAGEAVELDLASLDASEQERLPSVFRFWGYENAGGWKDEKELKPGEYLIKDGKMWIVFKPGIHPHSFFGLTEDNKIFTGAIPEGVTQYFGMTLEELSKILIKEYKAKDLFLWGNGKDNFLEAQDASGITTVKAQGAYGKGYSAFIVAKKKSRSEARTQQWNPDRWWDSRVIGFINSKQDIRRGIGLRLQHGEVIFERELPESIKAYQRGHILRIHQTGINPKNGLPVYSAIKEPKPGDMGSLDSILNPPDAFSFRFDPKKTYYDNVLALMNMLSGKASQNGTVRQIDRSAFIIQPTVFPSERVTVEWGEGSDILTIGVSYGKKSLIVQFNFKPENGAAAIRTTLNDDGTLIEESWIAVPTPVDFGLEFDGALFTIKASPETFDALLPASAAMQMQNVAFHALELKREIPSMSREEVETLIEGASAYAGRKSREIRTAEGEVSVWAEAYAELRDLYAGLGLRPAKDLPGFSKGSWVQFLKPYTGEAQARELVAHFPRDVFIRLRSEARTQDSSRSYLGSEKRRSEVREMPSGTNRSIKSIAGRDDNDWPVYLWLLPKLLKDFPDIEKHLEEGDAATLLPVLKTYRRLTIQRAIWRSVGINSVISLTALALLLGNGVFIWRTQVGVACLLCGFLSGTVATVWSIVTWIKNHDAFTKHLQAIRGFEKLVKKAQTENASRSEVRGVEEIQARLAEAKRQLGRLQSILTSLKVLKKPAPAVISLITNTEAQVKNLEAEIAQLEEDLKAQTPAVKAEQEPGAEDSKTQLRSAIKANLRTIDDALVYISQRQRNSALKVAHQSLGVQNLFGLEEYQLVSKMLDDLGTWEFTDGEIPDISSVDPSPAEYYGADGSWQGPMVTLYHYDLGPLTAFLESHEFTRLRDPKVRMEILKQLSDRIRPSFITPITNSFRQFMKHLKDLTELLKGEAFLKITTKAEQLKILKNFGKEHLPETEAMRSEVRNAEEQPGKAALQRSPLNIVVTVKQVPDTANVKINPETNTLVREGVQSILNPFDLYAIEEALRLKEKFGGTVTVISMGPPQAENALREAIAMGADRGVLLSDRAFAGSDTWATSKVLSAAIKKLGEEKPVDLVFSGKQATDGDTAQVGPGIAAHLDLPQVTYVRKIDQVSQDSMTVQRMMDDGYESVRTQLPALLTVVKEINEPRLPSLKGRISAKKAVIPKWTIQELGLDPKDVGLEGSPTKVVRIFTPPPRAQVEMIAGSLEEIGDRLARIIVNILLKKEIPARAPPEDKNLEQTPEAAKPSAEPKAQPVDTSSMTEAIKVLADLCNRCGACVKACKFGAIKLGEELPRIAVIDMDQCRLCGACKKACPVHAILMKEKKAVNLKSYKDIWVFLEQKNGIIQPVSYELLGKARELASKLGCNVVGIYLGAKPGAGELQKAVFQGADQIVSVEASELADFKDESYAKVMNELIRLRKPAVILSGATNVGRSFIPRVAVMARAGLTADCTGLDIDPATGNLLQTRPAFGGNIMATIIDPNHRPQMATVRHKVMKPMVPDTTRTGNIENVSLDPSLFTSRTEVLGPMGEGGTGVNLAEANVVVAGGRGLMNAENFRYLAELAGVLGGVVGASRAPVDANWIGYPHQVGQTGKTIAPKLYIAAGISGQIQHLAGIASSENIIAINKDPAAPIFQAANYGVVGNFLEIAPILTEKIKKLLAAEAPRSEARAESDPSRPRWGVLIGTFAVMGIIFGGILVYKKLERREHQRAKEKKSARQNDLYRNFFLQYLLESPELQHAVRTRWMENPKNPKSLEDYILSLNVDEMDQILKDWLQAKSQTVPEKAAPSLTRPETAPATEKEKERKKTSPLPPAARPGGRYEITVASTRSEVRNSSIGTQVIASFEDFAKILRAMAHHEDLQQVITNVQSVGPDQNAQAILRGIASPELELSPKALEEIRSWVALLAQKNNDARTTADELSRQWGIEINFQRLLAILSLWIQDKAVRKAFSPLGKSDAFQRTLVSFYELLEKKYFKNEPVLSADIKALGDAEGISLQNFVTEPRAQNALQGILSKKTLGFVDLVRTVEILNRYFWIPHGWVFAFSEYTSPEGKTEKVMAALKVLGVIKGVHNRDGKNISLPNYFVRKVRSTFSEWVASFNYPSRTLLFEWATVKKANHLLDDFKMAARVHQASKAKNQDLFRALTPAWTGGYFKRLLQAYPRFFDTQEHFDMDLKASIVMAYAWHEMFHATVDKIIQNIKEDPFEHVLEDGLKESFNDHGIDPGAEEGFPRTIEAFRNKILQKNGELHKLLEADGSRKPGSLEKRARLFVMANECGATLTGLLRSEFPAEVLVFNIIGALESDHVSPGSEAARFITGYFHERLSKMDPKLAGLSVLDSMASLFDLSDDQIKRIAQDLYDREFQPGLEATLEKPRSEVRELEELAAGWKARAEANPETPNGWEMPREKFGAGKRVCVVGGLGFIGSNTAWMMEQLGYEVMVYDNRTTGHIDALPKGVTLEKGDISEGEHLARFLKEKGIDTVVHFAADIQVAESVANPSKYYEDNVRNTGILLEAMRIADVKNIIFSSSAAVYGNPEHTPISEDARKLQTSPYGRTKWAMEQMIREYVRQYGFKAVALRYFNASGAFVSLDPTLSGSFANRFGAERGYDRVSASHIIPIFVNRALKGQDITIFGNDYETQDGTNDRDYVATFDLAIVHALAAKRLQEMTEPDYFAANVGTGIRVSNLQIAQRVIREIERQLPGWKYTGKILFGARRPGDPAVLEASTELAANELGFKAKIGIEEIIASDVRWRIAHPQGYQDELLPTAPEPGVRARLETVLRWIEGSSLSGAFKLALLKDMLADEINKYREVPHILLPERFGYLGKAGSESQLNAFKQDMRKKDDTALREWISREDPSQIAILDLLDAQIARRSETRTEDGTFGALLQRLDALEAFRFSDQKPDGVYFFVDFNTTGKRLFFREPAGDGVVEFIDRGKRTHPWLREWKYNAAAFASLKDFAAKIKNDGALPFREWALRTDGDHAALKNYLNRRFPDWSKVPLSQTPAAQSSPALGQDPTRSEVRYAPNEKPGTTERDRSRLAPWHIVLAVALTSAIGFWQMRNSDLESSFKWVFAGGVVIGALITGLRHALRLRVKSTDRDRGETGKISDVLKTLETLQELRKKARVALDQADERLRRTPENSPLSPGYAIDYQTARASFYEADIKTQKAQAAYEAFLSDNGSRSEVRDSFNLKSGLGDLSIQVPEKPLSREAAFKAVATIGRMCAFLDGTATETPVWGQNITAPDIFHWWLAKVPARVRLEEWKRSPQGSQLNQLVTQSILNASGLTPQVLEIFERYRAVAERHGAFSQEVTPLMDEFESLINEEVRVRRVVPEDTNLYRELLNFYKSALLAEGQYFSSAKDLGVRETVASPFDDSLLRRFTNDFLRRFSFGAKTTGLHLSDEAKWTVFNMSQEEMVIHARAAARDLMRHGKFQVAIHLYKIFFQPRDVGGEKILERWKQDRDEELRQMKLRGFPDVDRVIRAISPVRSLASTYEEAAIPQTPAAGTGSLRSELRVAGEVVARIVSPLLSGSTAFAADIKPQLFANTAHYLEAPVLPPEFVKQWPAYSAIVSPLATASAGRTIIDQRQGVPDAGSILPLTTFARYDRHASVVLALIADPDAVARFEKELAALCPNGILPENFKIRTFASEDKFVNAFAGFYNGAAPYGRSVALITDREDSVVTQKIGSRKKLLSVVGGKDPLKQTASALLAADKLLNEAIWSMGYHFVSVEKLGGLEALMAELAGFIAAQTKVSASA
jgi:electron transfer flavoprotein alpha subunit